MELSEFFSVPVITATCYAIIQIYKYTINSNEKYLRFIPLISATIGIALSVTAFYIDKNIILASNVFNAILMGLTSGLAATGTHQAIKQLSTKASNTQTDTADNSKNINNTKNSEDIENNNLNNNDNNNNDNGIV